MSRLLVITQRVDDADDLLGFFVGWLREFSKHYEQVSVIALGVGSYELPPNIHVYSLGKERGVPRWRQALSGLRLLWRYTPRRGGVFCHMSPVFAVWAWPFARLRGSRLVLWYLHRSVTARLRLALLFCSKLVTADRQSLSFQSPKVVSVGHGIDVARFGVPGRQALGDRPLRVLSVGRLSPIKDYATLIRSAALVRDQQVPLDVRIIGRAVMPVDYAYAREMGNLVARVGVSDIVHFFGFVPYRDMPAHYRWADVVVGCTPRGGLDKALLEGMAAGCVVLTSNEVMQRYLGPYGDQLVFRHGDAEDLAGKLERLVALDRIEMSGTLRAAVREHHDLSRAIANIVKYL